MIAYFLGMYTLLTLIVLDKDKQQFECNKAPKAKYLLFRQEVSRPGLEIRKWVYKSIIGICIRLKFENVNYSLEINYADCDETTPQRWALPNI